VFVVMVASECAPVAQAGGLGEVVFGLSREFGAVPAANGL
jgi:starch synthase